MKYWLFGNLGIAMLAVMSCGQPATQDGTTAITPVASASAAPLPGSPPKDPSDDAEDAVATDPFGDGARAFATVKDTLLKNYYAEGLTEDDLYRAATAGMLEKLDPRMKSWNHLISAKEYAELQNDLKGEVVGIGVRISFDQASGYSDVLGTIPGSPSEKAGLVAGDKIVTVDGKLYKGQQLKDVVAQIRGKAGDRVALSVLRGDKLVPFTVTRERVLFDQPSHTLFAGGLGYIDIPSFTEKTPAQVKDALDDLVRNHAKALIVDLRRNPGGSFDSAVATAELFLKDGTGIVTLKKKDKAEERHVAPTGKGLLLDVPLAVLISNATNSGAELLTGALQEGRQARIVGQHTHGKWSVQSLDTLPNGYAYKYTVSLFRTPSGRSFDGTGLPPDVEVTMDPRDLDHAVLAAPADRIASDVQLRTAKELLLPK